jgi:hypothetical protein
MGVDAGLNAYHVFWTEATSRVVGIGMGHGSHLRRVFAGEPLARGYAFELDS